MRYYNSFKIGGKTIGGTNPVYFIADIAANHDGNIERAKKLIHLAAEAGADAAKFQHFTAETIVSDFGFRSLGRQQSHQSKWKKSVFDVYRDASLNLDWTETLNETCKNAGIAFFTSPYSHELTDRVDSYVPAYKIGSGELTWLDLIAHISKKKKPVFIATGASNVDEVASAVNTVLAHNHAICLMQCNTNYTSSFENYKFIHLNVLKTYAAMYPDMVLGLSDHTPSHATVLGAVALGARAIEKHFTDDTKRVGPDHRFSIDPKSWREMVDRTRELELALGTGVKKVEDNEKETVILQRRSIRIKKSLPAGTQLQEEHLISLRPCPLDGIAPHSFKEVIGRKLSRGMTSGEHIRWSDISE